MIGRSYARPWRKLAVLNNWKAPNREYVSFSLSDLFHPDDDGNSPEHDGSTLPRAQFINNRYIGPWDRKSRKGLWKTMKWLALGDEESRSLTERLKQRLKGGSDTKDLIIPDELCRSTLDMTTTSHITWVGHATCALQMDGLRILTDPIFEDYASPIPGVGPKRYMSPIPSSVEGLPQTDVILLSHTHYDHLCGTTATNIGNRPLWVVPLGVGKKLEMFGVTNVVELDWWQECDMEVQRADGGGAATLKVTLTPAVHWTARGVFDKNDALWGSFCLLSPTSGTRIFFGGDTAYSKSLFGQIGERYGPFDLAILPIGAYKPRWFMKDVHCDPEEAVLIHHLLQAKQTLGVHWGTFDLADDDFIEPALDLAWARQKHGLTPSDIFTLKHGSTFILGGDPVSKDFASMPQHASLLQSFLEYKAAKD